MSDSHITPSSQQPSTTSRPDLSSFYNPTVPPIPPPFSTLLSTYSSIPPSSQESHILTVRNKAYKIYPFPCLGRFRFLYLELSTHPLYTTHILPLLTHPESTFLDIGTCLGQDLRKLIHDGVPVSHIHGADLEWNFIDTGYELFADEARFPREQFLVPSDMLDPSRDATQILDGRCDVVNVTAVFHLFDLAAQQKIARRVLRLLKRGDGRKLIVGSDAGMLEAGVYETRGGTRFRHNVESWRGFWEGVFKHEGEGVEWEVGGFMERFLWRGNGDGDGRADLKDSERGDDGHHWHVWWVWVEFSQ